MNSYLIAQILVGISTVIYIISLFVNSAKSLLLFQVFSTIFYASQFIFLNAYVGTAIALVDLARIITFYIVENKTEAYKPRIYSGICFISIAIILTIITWGYWFSFLPLVGLIAINLALMTKNLICIKASCLFSCLCSITYLLLLSSYFGCITQVIVFVLGFIGLIIEIKRNKKENSTQPVQNVDNQLDSNK